MQNGGKNRISFSPVASTKVGISLRNILTFNFDNSATLLRNFKVIPSPVPNYLTLTKSTPQNTWFYW